MALATNLVSYWKLDANSNDSVTTNNGTDTAISYATAGKIGNCATFNGSTSKIVIADASTLKPTGNFTIGAWVKTTANDKQIFQSYSQNTAVAGYFLDIQADGTARFVSGKNTGTTLNTDFKSAVGAVVNDGNWHLVVGTYDGTNINIYIDSNTAVSASWTNAPAYNATNYIRIGCRNNSGTDISLMNGSIDEALFYSRALTADEVSQLFNSGRGNAYPLTDTPSLYGGVAYYKLDESSGNASDSIGSNTLTNTNTVTYSAGKINNGANFVGASNQYLIKASPTGLPSGTSAFTVSAWFKQATFSIYDTILWFGTNSTNQQIAFCVDSATSIRIYMAGDYLVTVPTMATNTWHHLVITFAGSGNGALVYINNTPATITAALTTNLGSSYLAIGDAFNGDATWMFNGSIDEVSIFNRALSSTEVTALYNSGNGSQYPFSIGAYVLSCVVGAFTLTGNAVNLSKGYVMTALTGAFNLVGNAVNLVVGGQIWTNIAKSVTSWTNSNKNTTTWSNTDKSDTTWNNINKN